jgi:hypothetical protein
VGAQMVLNFAVVLAWISCGTRLTAAGAAFNAPRMSTARGVPATVFALAANEAAARIIIHIPSTSEVLIMERLDELSKLLAGSVSRRESLRGIGAVLAGAAFGSLGLRAAWAAGPDRCIAFCRCSNKAQQNQCLSACRACNSNTSRLCGSCGNYACCAASADCCSGTCTSVNSDPQNCGACGNVCAAGAFCVNGICNAGPCFGGQAFCDGACREIALDPSYCGGCDISCGPNENCAGGLCQPAE